MPGCSGRVGSSRYAAGGGWCSCCWLPDAAWNGFESAGWLLSALILAAMAYHLLAYERGRDQAGTDFAVSLAGIL